MLGDNYLVKEPNVAPATRIPGSKLELDGGIAARPKVGIHAVQSTRMYVVVVDWDL